MLSHKPISYVGWAEKRSLFVCVCVYLKNICTTVVKDPRFESFSFRLTYTGTLHTDTDF
jgi:hypothetical protein